MKLTLSSSKTVRNSWSNRCSNHYKHCRQPDNTSVFTANNKQQKQVSHLLPAWRALKTMYWFLLYFLWESSAHKQMKVLQLPSIHFEFALLLSNKIPHSDEKSTCYIEFECFPFFKDLITYQDPVRLHQVFHCSALCQKFWIWKNLQEIMDSIIQSE